MTKFRLRKIIFGSLLILLFVITVIFVVAGNGRYVEVALFFQTRQNNDIVAELRTLPVFPDENEKIMALIETFSFGPVSMDLKTGLVEPPRVRAAHKYNGGLYINFDGNGLLTTDISEIDIFLKTLERTLIFNLSGIWRVEYFVNGYKIGDRPYYSFIQ